MNQEDIWEGVCAALQLELSPAHYATWIVPLVFEGLEDLSSGVKVIKLMAPSPYVRGMLTTKYQRQVVDAATKIVGGEVRISVVVGKTESKTAKLLGTTKSEGLFEPRKEAVEPQHNLNPRLKLDSYVVGSSNNFAHAAALGVIKNPGRKYNPLFIYGGVGLGKTHLMHGVGHAILETNPRLKILYITAETFGNDLIASLQSKKVATFKRKYRSCDVLLIDDIQFISGKEYTQEEFFHTFNELYMSERQIILTSDRPPQEIPKIEERLSSRFLGGLTVDIQPPDYEMRMAILTQKAQEAGIQVESQALSLIAERETTNARALEGNFRRIAAQADSQGQPLSEAMVASFYGEAAFDKRMRVRPSSVISKVSKYFGFKTQELLGNSRKAPLVLARHAAMYLIKTELEVPHEKIGEMFGGRDHTTVMHAVEKITAEISSKREVGQAISEIKHLITTSGNG